MKLQPVGLSFCAEPKKNESENSSKIFLCALGGSTMGAAAGALARNYAPVSDEFFHQVSTGSSDKKQDVDEAVNNFVESYSASEIDEARTLKTVLLQADIAAETPQGKGIAELLADNTIKPIGKDDSEEVNNAYKALHTQLAQEIKTAKEQKNLPEKFESLSLMASENHSKAKQGIFVRDNLQQFKKQIRGLSDDGKQNIAEIKNQIEQTSGGTDEMKKELSSAFKSMVRIAQKTQRPIEAWTIIPGIISGLFGMGVAVNYRIQKDLAKNKKNKELLIK